MGSEQVDSPSIAERIEAFEAALLAGDATGIPDLSPTPDTLPLLVELIHVEMEYLLKHGREARVSDYLARFPRLLEDRAAVAGLIGAEYRFRSRRTPSLTRESFLARYPDFAADVPPPPLTSRATRARDTELMRQALEAQPGRTIAGRYTLVERLGEGGMGEVWVARQIEPVRRDVAIKLIKPGMDSRAVLQRFEAERQALAMMDHPHIARVLDAGLTDALRPFFVMELVQGVPLTTYCDREQIGIRKRLELFILICRAVQHAHQKGIVHRDLKPSNILVAEVDGRPVPKVIDFGLAKATNHKPTPESLATAFGTVVGTVEYMAPEQAGSNGDDVDTRADIYSLGVVLYELLTGLRPFDPDRIRAAAFDEMMRMIREEEPSRPSIRLASGASTPSAAAVRRIEPAQLKKLLEKDLDWLVMKCLEKQRERRYETADALSRDIERYLADEPIEARPPGKGYRIRKFLRRNRRSVIAAGLIYSSLALGIAGTVVGLLRAERARAQAAIDRETARANEAAAAQVTEFLVRTFQAADPIGLEVGGFGLGGTSGGRKTERRILDRGTEIVREYLHDQPTMRAQLLGAMGNAYRSLAEWDLARALLGESYELRKQMLGDENELTLTSLQSLALLAADRGDYNEAEALFRRVIAGREKLFTRDSLPVAESKAYLGWLTFSHPLSGDLRQFNEEKVKEAEQLLLECLRVREAKLPADHRDIGYVLAAIAAVKATHTKVEADIRPYLTRAAEIFRKNEGVGLLGNVLVEMSLAEVLRKQQQVPAAEAIYLRVLDRLKADLGPRHPLVILHMGALAGLYRAAPDPIKAEKVVLEILSLVRDLPSMRSMPAIVDIHVQYAIELKQARGEAVALPLFREALSHAKERPSGNEKNLGLIEVHCPSLFAKPK